MTSKEIRKAFLDFFASKGHAIVPSAPVVVKNDPTLMFTNAGMNQFKDIFLGNSPIGASRVADSQKCLRVSGKHNDLEEVGHDTYHHTLFEMLGNWSFGDYFKEEAISWAWELLTEVFGIDKGRLYATVFEGSEADGVPMDSEARDIWARFLPEDHIITGNKHDNFWEMGETGPCGPCSEIHIDLRDDSERDALPGRELVNKDHHLVIEIWNLVFMQYNRKAGGNLERLPRQHVDTGMGFERLCMALQGKKSNYDTDVFTNMISTISALCAKPYDPDSDEGVAMRVIADHIRAIAFSITDGQLPSNVKAGYVIRRILRRAVRYGYTFLELRRPFLCRLVPQLVEDMGEAFPEIKAQQTLVEKVIREEEESFLRTLDKGIRLMDDILVKSAATKLISGKDAFQLYDTYGFPIDLSELIAREKGYTIDMKEFEAELGRQKERARNATANSFGDWTLYHEGDSVEFTGYDTTEVSGALLLRQRTVVQKNKEMLQLVFDRTPFYGEMGGEIGDTGTITSADGRTIKIVNTVKENDLTLHIAESLPENPSGEFTLRVDAPRRQRISNNHTCTHLLHSALREILGNSVEQKGSYVSDKGFRFDFSHYEKLSDEQLKAVEKRVNEMIRSNFPLQEKRSATMEEAMEMGAVALFGEKYGDRVRVVRFGPSTELCGGCHTSSTGNIGLFKIMGESAIAAGVRRIEAISGEYAEEYVYGLQATVHEARSFFNNAPDLSGAIRKMVEENAGFKKQAEEFARVKAVELARSLKGMAKEAGGISLIVARPAADQDPAVLRNAALLLQKELKNTALVSAYEAGGKPQLMLMYSDDLVAAGRNAGKQIGEAARLVQGGGGGQPGLATAGGKDVAGLDAAEKRLIELATA